MFRKRKAVERVTESPKWADLLDAAVERYFERNPYVTKKELPSLVKEATEGLASRLRQIEVDNGSPLREGDHLALKSEVEAWKQIEDVYTRYTNPHPVYRINHDDASPTHVWISKARWDEYKAEVTYSHPPVRVKRSDLTLVDSWVFDTYIRQQKPYHQR